MGRQRDCGDAVDDVLPALPLDWLGIVAPRRIMLEIIEAEAGRFEDARLKRIYFVYFRCRSCRRRPGTPRG
jgi:hypothetical protein